MSKFRAQPNALFKAIGKLAVRWNDLELQLRRLTQHLTDDWLSTLALTVDLQAVSLIHSIKVLTAEHDANKAKLTRFLEEARPKTGHRVRSPHLVAEHVGQLLKCADSLRLHRNLYVHCINSPTRDIPYFTLGGISARSGRLSIFETPIRLREIAKVTTAIERTVRYAAKIERCVMINNEHHLAPPRWPKKLDPYAPLKKPLNSVSERIPLF